MRARLNTGLSKSDSIALAQMQMMMQLVISRNCESRPFLGCLYTRPHQSEASGRGVPVLQGIILPPTPTDSRDLYLAKINMNHTKSSESLASKTFSRTRSAMMDKGDVEITVMRLRVQRTFC